MADKNYHIDEKEIVHRCFLNLIENDECEEAWRILISMNSILILSAADSNNISYKGILSDLMKDIETTIRATVEVKRS